MLELYLASPFPRVANADIHHSLCEKRASPTFKFLFFDVKPMPFISRLPCPVKKGCWLYPICFPHHFTNLDQASYFPVKINPTFSYSFRLPFQITSWWISSAFSLLLPHGSCGVVSRTVHITSVLQFITVISNDFWFAKVSHSSTTMQYFTSYILY